MQTRMGAVRGLMDRLESELLRVEVVVAAQPSLQEARARERLSLHKDALRSLQGQLRELKPVLRRNQEAQAAKEREELLSSLGSSHNDSEKRTLLREAERGTHALHEASQMMRHVSVLFSFETFYFGNTNHKIGAGKDASSLGSDARCLATLERCH